MRALVGERVDAAFHDLVVGTPARRDAPLLAVVGDQALDDGIGDRIALAGLVAIPAGAGLLPEAPQLAQAIGDLRVRRVGVLHVAALADRPADVVAGEGAPAEEPHRQAQLLERPVYLLGRRAFLRPVEALPLVLL